jgi:hypothetical protein
MQNPDSFDRIVSYFHALARKPFEYHGETQRPYSALVLSEKVFRDYTCPTGCGACCMKVSLVFDRPRPSDVPVLDLHEFTVNGRSLSFPVDPQTDRRIERFCRHLDENGRCGIYEYRPLPCRFELFKFVHKPTLNRAYGLVRLPGRGQVLLRVDSERGNKCEIRPYSPNLTKSHVDDLRIIETWMTHFGIANDCQTAIRYLETGPHSKPLVVKRTSVEALV